MDSEGVQADELVKKGVEGGSKKNQGRRAAVGSSSSARNMEAGDVAELVTRRMTVTVIGLTCFSLDKVSILVYVHTSL